MKYEGLNDNGEWKEFDVPWYVGIWTYIPSFTLFGILFYLLVWGDIR